MAASVAPQNGSQPRVMAPMATRRGWANDAVYFDHTGPCTDPACHRQCPAAGARSSASGQPFL
jgi:hypothetical protein